MEVDWLRGLDAFYKAWFPNDGVQSFWFAARKASHRAFFEKLDLETLEAARYLAKCLSRNLLATWALPRKLRMRCAIFLDQTCRNHLAIRREPEAQELKELCDAVALNLALATVHDGPVVSMASVPELCFLSLVLRHAREEFSLRLSEKILLAMLEEQVEHGELCHRFLEETRD